MQVSSKGGDASHLQRLPQPSGRPTSTRFLWPQLGEGAADARHRGVRLQPRLLRSCSCGRRCGCMPRCVFSPAGAAHRTRRGPVATLPLRHIVEIERKCGSDYHALPAVERCPRLIMSAAAAAQKRTAAPPPPHLLPIMMMFRMRATPAALARRFSTEAKKCGAIAC
jgi:hypothetical protein